MARCYFPGCESHGNTKEHIPPKSFFPDSKRVNLMTVKSCKVHNNEKTKDDIYALAHICLNSITKSESDVNIVFETNVKPQLLFNNQAFLKKVLRNVSKRDATTSKFEVDSSRLDSFFDCLTHGVIYKKLKKKIELTNYSVKHMYMNFEDRDINDDICQQSSFTKAFFQNHLLNDSDLSDCIEFNFQDSKGYSTEIYSVRFIGADFIESLKSSSFNSSITVVHKFFGHFEVVSMLTRIASF